jgi:5-methylcytosine-specific restriction endonuclease McrBC GTP-binding regulatory subunit McrB
MFTWLPFFQEMAQWILAYRNRQNELCDILRKIGFEGNLEDEVNGVRESLQVMDPFTFFAFFMKIKNEQNRIAYFTKFKEASGLKSQIPADFNGVPSAQPMMLWYFRFKQDRPPELFDHLWNLAEQAVGGKLNEEDFQYVFNRPGIRIAKLSQGLFWLNPTQFYPIDAHKNYLEENGINIEIENLADYLKVLEKIKATFQKPFYEISHAAWRNNNGHADDYPVEEITYIQTTDMSKLPALNKILYGPPGTGKTYTSIDRALEIIDPKFYSANKHDRLELTKKFNSLLIKDFNKSEGQIAFCTFHQSMSYEDFIEGIKPVINEGVNEGLKYVIKDGILKIISRRAEEATEKKEILQRQVFSLTAEEFDKAIFYKMSLGNTLSPEDDDIYTHCINNNCIALGWGGDNDYTGLDTAEIFKKAKENGQSDFSARQVNMFSHFMKQGNYVIISQGNYRFRAIGKITGEYEYNDEPDIEYPHFRKVEWLLQDVDLPVSDVYNHNFQQQTLYKLNQQEVKKDFFVKAAVNVPMQKEPDKYVLIIDEINRGNVSQIFGELITLIEEDKRKGQPEALSVTLPYSKESFSVPSNLYIVGTMNTADRSVEALDTALRRRFVFEEMMPRPDLLHPKQMLCAFWNESSNISVQYDQWLEEPFKARADVFYELIGMSRELEAEIMDVEYEHERINWVVEDLINVPDDDFTGLRLDAMLETINERLELLLTKDHTIGHAWLMNVYNMPALQNAFKNKILPLLQEFFYNDHAKIGLVLGNSFVRQKQRGKSAFASFTDINELASEYEDRIIYNLVDPATIDLQGFKSIYE